VNMKKDINLTGKKILVTAGSTWVAIDDVRVITNIFKGKIGLTIAIAAAEFGAAVTLLLGSSLDISCMNLPSTLRVVRFKYFEELDDLMTENLRSGNYDAVIHSAAVSDFKLAKKHEGKIKSNTGNLTLELVPTKKIVDGVKKLAPEVFLVKFKLEVGISVERLIEVASDSMRQSSADLVVANIYNPNFTDHEAYIIDISGKVTNVQGKEAIALKILENIYEGL